MQWISAAAGCTNYAGVATTALSVSRFPTSNEETRLRLDGSETKVGPAVLVLRPINPYTFEIVTRRNRPSWSSDRSRGSSFPAMA
jgi:hypothetical protein